MLRMSAYFIALVGCLSSDCVAQLNSPMTIGPAPVAKAPFDTRQAKALQDAWAKRLGTTVTSTNSLGTTMVLIPPGEFLMGSSDEQIEAALKMATELKIDQRTQDRIRNQERPQHRMLLAGAYLLAATEVTIAQFRTFVTATGYRTEAEVLGTGNPAATEKAAPKDRNGFTWRSPGFAQREAAAVSQVSWNDAVVFCNWLSEREADAFVRPRRQKQMGT
jgi:formylglycine-generating enzyme required for sulfatase activity